MVATRSGVHVCPTNKSNSDELTGITATPSSSRRTIDRRQTPDQPTQPNAHDDVEEDGLTAVPLQVPSSTVKRRTRASTLQTDRSHQLDATHEADVSESESCCSVMSGIEQPIVRRTRRKAIRRSTNQEEMDVSEEESCSSVTSASKTGSVTRLGTKRSTDSAQPEPCQGVSEESSCGSVVSESKRVTRSQKKSIITRSSTRHHPKDTEVVSEADSCTPSISARGRRGRIAKPIPIHLEEATEVSQSPSRSTRAGRAAADTQSWDSEGFESGPSMTPRRSTRRQAPVRHTCPGTTDSESELMDMYCTPLGSPCSSRGRGTPCSSRTGSGSSSRVVPISRVLVLLEKTVIPAETPEEEEGAGLAEMPTENSSQGGSVTLSQGAEEESVLEDSRLDTTVSAEDKTLTLEEKEDYEEIMDFTEQAQPEIIQEVNQGIVAEESQRRSVTIAEEADVEKEEATSELPKSEGTEEEATSELAKSDSTEEEASSELAKSEGTEEEATSELAKSEGTEEEATSELAKSEGTEEEATSELAKSEGTEKEATSELAKSEGTEEEATSERAKSEETEEEATSELLNSDGTELVNEPAVTTNDQQRGQSLELAARGEELVVMMQETETFATEHSLSQPQGATVGNSSVAEEEEREEGEAEEAAGMNVAVTSHAMSSAAHVDDNCLLVLSEEEEENGNQKVVMVGRKDVQVVVLEDEEKEKEEEVHVVIEEKVEGVSVVVLGEEHEESKEQMVVMVERKDVVVLEDEGKEKEEELEGESVVVLGEEDKEMEVTAPVTDQAGTEAPLHLPLPESTQAGSIQVTSSQHVTVAVSEVIPTEEPQDSVIVQKARVISLLESSEDEEEEEEEEEEDEEGSRDDDDDDEEEEEDVMYVDEDCAGSSQTQPKADGMFVIDTQPGLQSDAQYYQETQDEAAPSAEDQDEEEFVDEEGDDDEDDDDKALFTIKNPLMELSSRIDPGLRAKQLGGLYISFDGSKSKSVSSNPLQKLKEQRNQEEVMKRSVIGPEFEKKDAVPPYSESKQAMKLKRKEEKEKTTGDGWFNMRAPEMTEELKGDLKALKMRAAMDPKRFYKKNDRDGFPKYFQVGTVVDSPVDFYHSRVPKKNRKRTMVEELLADAEFRHNNKKKYQQIMVEKAAIGAGKKKRKRNKFSKK